MVEVFLSSKTLKGWKQNKYLITNEYLAEKRRDLVAEEGLVVSPQVPLDDDVAVLKSRKDTLWGKPL